MNSAGFFALTLISKTREYGHVYTLRFEPETPVSFVPGQYVHLLAPASPPGRENVRHLSIASVPQEGPLWFSVDLSPTSEYKQKLAALEIGGKAHMFKVKGEFILGPQPPAQAVFFAGGIGITPVRSLIKQIVTEGLSTEWRLAHVARDGWLYETELAQFGGEQRRIRRPAVEALVNQWTRDWPDAAYYVSGSDRFVEGLSHELEQFGVPGDRIHMENFH